MQSLGRPIAWLLGLFVVALALAAVLAMTGTLGMDATILGTYTGMHVAGVVLAVVGVLALVVVLSRRTAKT